jgi:beta-glucosidase-like glycosyl hydrolase
MRTTAESVIPPRALHQLYLLPFEMSVKDAPVVSIMCAYSQLNGLPACSNADLLTTTLREPWGFQRWVTSDRRSIHDFASITAGVNAGSRSHALVAREIAQQSIVLLKNQNRFLPLNAAALKSVARGKPQFIGDPRYRQLATEVDGETATQALTLTLQEPEP